MENFKVNEYFKDYVAIQKEYFSDLKKVTAPIEKDGKITSIVLLNGEEYEKTDWLKDNLIHILFLPKKTYQTSPTIELIASDKHIKIETHKIVNGNLLEYKQYSFLSNDGDKGVNSLLITQYFDISDELDDERYVFKHLLEKGLEGKTNKKIVGEIVINAKRTEEATDYASLLNKCILSKKTEYNKIISLFELLSSVEKQIVERSNKIK